MRPAPGIGAELESEGSSLTIAERRMARGSSARKSSPVETSRQARPRNRRRTSQHGLSPRHAAKHSPAGGAGTMKYLVVIEKTKTGFSAYSPDLQGCVAAARTRPSVLRAMRKAVEFHLEGLRLQGMRRPDPGSDF